MTLRPPPPAANGIGGNRSPPTKADVRGRYVEVGFGGGGGGAAGAGAPPLPPLAKSSSSYENGNAPPLLPAAPLWAGASTAVRRCKKLRIVILGLVNSPT